MAQARVAERYAKALLDLSNEQSLSSDVNDDMKMVLQSIDVSRELELLLNNPVVSTAKKTAVFSKIFESKMNPLSFNFIKLVLQKRRESDFGSIAKSFTELYNKQMNVTTVEVTTAVSVDQETLDLIVEKIKTKNQLQNIEVSHSVNPSLIGGFIAEFNNRIWDQSVQTNINQIKRRFSVN